MIESKYQSWLEKAITPVMMLVMFTSALSFLMLPNQQVFDRLALAKINITPAQFAVGCLIGMVCYPLLLLPIVRHADITWRRIGFDICAAPILAYSLPVGYFLWLTGGNPLTITVYVAIYVLIILTGIALYRGKDTVREQFRLELVAVALMIALMLLGAWGFAFHPNMDVFNATWERFGIGFTPGTLAVLCALGAVGYSLILVPRFQRSIATWRRFWFGVCASPYLLYIIPLAYYMIKTANGISSAIFLALFALVVLLGLALYRR